MKTLEEYKKDLEEKEYFVKHNKECLENYKKKENVNWGIVATTQMFIDNAEKELPALRALVAVMEKKEGIK